MSRRITARQARGWVIGIVVGIAAGSGTAIATQQWQESREAADIERRTERFELVESVPDPVDAVRELVEQDRLVAVDPLLAEQLPEADRERAEEILASSPVPARIAYLSEPSNNDVGYTASGAAAMWRAAIGDEGFYVVMFDGGSTDSGAVGLEEEYVSAQTRGQPGPALVRLAEDMATWEAEPLTLKTDDLDLDDDWGGTFGGIAFAALIGGFVVAPLFFLLRWYVGTRRRKET